MAQPARKDDGGIDPPVRTGGSNSLLAVLGLAGVMTSLSQTLVLPLIPQFPAWLDITVAQSGWIATSTMLVSAVTAPILGWLGDKVGLKPVIILSIALLAIGSLIAALTDSFAAVILGRVLQGMGAGVIGLSLALLRHVWDSQSLPFAMGVLAGSIGIGTSLGVPISGLIVSVVSWHWVFWVTGAGALLTLVLTVMVVPDPPAQAKGRFDVIGVMLLSAGVILLMIPLSNAAIWTWSDPVTLTFIVTGVVLIGAWLRHDLKVDQPFVNLRTFAHRGVGVSHGVAMLMGFAFFLSFSATVGVVQAPAIDGAGMGGTVLLTGLVQLPASLAAIAAGPLAGLMTLKQGPRLAVLAGIGTAVCAFGLRMLNLSDPYAVAITAMLVSGGLSFAFAALPVALTMAAPLSQSGTSFGINMLSRQMGASLASTLAALILADSLLGDAIGPLPFYVVFALGGTSAAVAFVLVLFLPAGLATMPRPINIPPDGGPT